MTNRKHSQFHVPETTNAFVVLAIALSFIALLLVLEYFTGIDTAARGQPIYSQISTPAYHKTVRKPRRAALRKMQRMQKPMHAAPGATK